MIELAWWLLVVGVCDLIRATRDVTTWRRRVLIAGTGTLLLIGGGIAFADDAGRAAVLVAGWVATYLMWILGSASAIGSRSGVARGAAFAGLGGGIAFGILGADLVARLSGSLPGALSAFDTERVLLGAGALAIQLASANVAVRLVLDVVGVPAATNEKKLKGGRMLGPLERLFILGLGLTGDLAAAAIVVAAKGLLRFPELQRAEAEEVGPSDVSEYFLIGSFASWLVALGGLGLMYLA